MKNSENPSCRVGSPLPGSCLEISMLVALVLLVVALSGCGQSGSIVITPGGIEIELWECTDTGEVLAVMPGDIPKNATFMRPARLLELNQ